MEQILIKPAAVRPRFFAALRSWIERIQANRQRSRNMKQVARLPDHILRDIGREDLITYPVNRGEHSH